MDDRPTTEQPNEVPRRTQSRPGGKGLLWGLLAVVIAFLIGFFWQFYEATTVRSTLAATEHELVVERLRYQLTNAALAAQGGRFEEARAEMSRFFNGIQVQQWALDDPLRDIAGEFLAMRDDVITGLSRGNPEYADVLFGMLERFQQAMPTTESAAPGEPAPRTPADDPATTGSPPGDRDAGR